MQLDYVDEVQHHKWNIMKLIETKVLAKCSARFLLLVWRWSWGDGTGPKLCRRHDMAATTPADAAVTAKIGKTSKCVLMVLYLSESWNYPEMIASKKELSDDMNCTQAHSSEFMFLKLCASLWATWPFGMHLVQFIVCPAPPNYLSPGRTGGTCKVWRAACVKVLRSFWSKFSQPMQPYAMEATAIHESQSSVFSGLTIIWQRSLPSFCSTGWSGWCGCGWCVAQLPLFRRRISLRYLVSQLTWHHTRFASQCQCHGPVMVLSCQPLPAPSARSPTGMSIPRLWTTCGRSCSSRPTLIWSLVSHRFRRVCCRMLQIWHDLTWKCIEKYF